MTSTRIPASKICDKCLKVFDKYLRRVKLTLTINNDKRNECVYFLVHMCSGCSRHLESVLGNDYDLNMIVVDKNEIVTKYGFPEDFLSVHQLKRKRIM